MLLHTLLKKFLDFTTHNYKCGFKIFISPSAAKSSMSRLSAGLQTVALKLKQVPLQHYTR
jgi:hypothetical protein